MKEKTLSDKQGYDDNLNRIYFEDELKESIKNIEFKLLKKFKMASVPIMKILKEEFGDKLI